jgi:hypothetical protein
MKHTIFATAVAGVLALTTAGCERPGSRGADKSTASSTSAEGAGGVQGTVRSVSGNQLKVSDAAGKEHTIKADKNTQVFRNGEVTSGVAQIPEGSQVRASFKGNKTNEPALRIDVIESGSGAAPAPSGTAPAPGGSAPAPSGTSPGGASKPGGPKY